MMIYALIAAIALATFAVVKLSASTKFATFGILAGFVLATSTASAAFQVAGIVPAIVALAATGTAWIGGNPDALDC